MILFLASIFLVEVQPCNYDIHTLALINIVNTLSTQNWN